MLLNVLFSDVPIEFTAATITIEIPAAMMAYSIAVAPVSSFTKRRTSFPIGNPSEVFCGARRQRCGRSAFDRMNATTKNVDDAGAKYPCA
jgi:hypothetical protein